MQTIWKSFEQLTTTELYAVLSLRQAVFMLEQRSIYQDIDGADLQAQHLLGHQNSNLVGYLRLLPKADRITVGRVVVAKPLRGQGVGLNLLNTALEWITDNYPTYPVCLSAQVDSQLFYERLGFDVVSKPYDDAGVLHVDMRKEG